MNGEVSQAKTMTQDAKQKSSFSDPKPKILLGIDGGGSKTIALVADLKGMILGRGSSGASNYLSVGFEAACMAIEQAIQAALKAAGLDSKHHPAALCLGLGGAGRPADVQRFEEFFKRRYPGIPLQVTTDAHLALAAGTQEGWGICLICGTGSIAYGRDSQGRQVRAGGWGYLFGDEGSGYAIGTAALRAVSQAADGRAPETLLTRLVLGYWELDDPMQIIPRVYYNAPSPRAEIARLAKVVQTAAEQGDMQAQSILKEAAKALAQLVKAIAKHPGFEYPMPLVVAGGVITHDEILFSNLLALVAELGLNFTHIEKVEEPALGAIRIAQNIFQAFQHMQR